MICSWIMCGLALISGGAATDSFHGAVRLSAHVIARRPEEFGAPMVGRAAYLSVALMETSLTPQAKSIRLEFLC
jgi:hypothetical protein